MVRVKICGITSVADARAAVAAGADALGFMFAPESRRYITPARARAIIRTLPPFVVPVGVFTDASARKIRSVREGCGLGAVQLNGAAATRANVRALRRGPVVAAVNVRSRRDVTGAARLGAPVLMFDAYDGRQAGGTGKTFNWMLLAGARPRLPFFLAGGLTPANVRRAIRAVRPFGVDVSTGVERSPGRKDARKVAAFIRAAKNA